MDITKIIIGVAVLLLTLITTYMIPWLKAKTGKTNWEQICKWAEIFVEGAESLIKGSKKGAERRDKVLQTLREECAKHNIKYSEIEIRLALEAAWGEMVTK